MIQNERIDEISKVINDDFDKLSPHTGNIKFAGKGS